MTRDPFHDVLAARSAHRTALVAAALAASLALGACGGDAAPEDTAATGMQGVQGMQDMPGMAGMPGHDTSAMAGMAHGGMQGGMLGRIQAHMRMLDGATPGQLAAMRDEHRQLVANMLAQMNREMRDMNMAADAAWTATVDSLRRDLVRLPDLQPAELRDAMPAHRGRIERLIEMHRAMMAEMGM